MLWGDPWYNDHPNQKRNRPQYASPPLPNILAGKTPTYLRKRGLVDPDDIVIDTGNSSRKATDEELLRDYGMLRCEGNCQWEMKDLGYASLPVLPNAGSGPRTMAEPCTTPGTTTFTVTAANPSTPTDTMVAQTASRVLSAVSSVITEGVEYAFWDGERHGDDEEDC